jgi:2-oxo-4-hydroxy-4-carboxy-5-ureidoimidazoline decarboxylase
MYTLDALNQMDQEQFVAALGDIFEATPAIAQQAWRDRPFITIADLHAKMVAVVQSQSPAAQLALLCAHPDLGGRVKMAAASVQEQAGVGLDRLSPEEFQRFQALNQAYKSRFGFPFIVAVKGHTQSSILAAFTRRLENSPEAEQQQALAEINQIARFRLEALVQG